MAHVEPGPYFPLYINDDGSIGKTIELRGGGSIKVNDASMVGNMIRIEHEFNAVCDAFHDKLMKLGVKAYRCNDGWVDRRLCKVTFFARERNQGYYWGNMHLQVGDKIFIGNAHDGGRFAEIIKTDEGDIYRMDSREYWYKPLDETLNGKDGQYITKNNAPKRSFWDRHFGKEPHYHTDIYEVWPIPEHSCLKCWNYCSHRDGCFCRAGYPMRNIDYKVVNHCEDFTTESKHPRFSDSPL